MASFIPHYPHFASSFIASSTSTSYRAPHQSLQNPAVSPCKRSVEVQPFTFQGVSVPNIVTAVLNDECSSIPDFKSMATSDPFLPSNPAIVVSLNPLTPKGEYVELIIDVSQSKVHQGHSKPGQTLRLGNPKAQRSESVVAVISSPPQSGSFLRFLIAADSDPCRLLKLCPGDSIVTGLVCGEGIDYSSAANNNGNLFLFVDAPQAFSVVTSLVEWPVFRTMTGTGANRRTKVTAFYSLSKASGIPYSHRFSDWCLYAVNIVPLQDQSILEFMSAQSSLSQTFYSAPSDYVVIAVKLEKSYEALFNALILLGFRRCAVSKFTEGGVTTIKRAYSQPQKSYSDFSGSKATNSLRSKSEEMNDEFMRQQLEEEIWTNWVDVREEMRAEFERKWVVDRGLNADHERFEEEKHNAWASWSARNDAQWTETKWDDQAWSDYWQTWNTTTSNENKQNFSDQGYSWNQSTSQEYWDSVGRGAQAYRSPGSSQYSKSQPNYGKNNDNDSYGGWGNANRRWSGYERRGYRYEYEDEGNSTKSAGRNHTGASSGGRNWGGWGNRRSSSSHSSKRNVTASNTNLDLYAVLGVSSTADRGEIKRAYRRKAMEHHPDKNPERPDDAHIKMKQIVVAWTVLKDEGSRKKYDSYGVGGF